MMFAKWGVPFLKNVEICLSGWCIIGKYVGYKDYDKKWSWNGVFAFKIGIF